MEVGIGRPRNRCGWRRYDGLPWSTPTRLINPLSGGQTLPFAPQCIIAQNSRRTQSPWSPACPTISRDRLVQLGACFFPLGRSRLRLKSTRRRAPPTTHTNSRSGCPPSSTTCCGRPLLSMIVAWSCRVLSSFRVWRTFVILKRQLVGSFLERLRFDDSFSAPAGSIMAEKYGRSNGSDPGCNHARCDIRTGRDTGAFSMRGLSDEPSRNAGRRCCRDREQRGNRMQSVLSGACGAESHARLGSRNLVRGIQCLRRHGFREQRFGACWWSCCPLQQP
jgi:hypothetical protein